MRGSCHCGAIQIETKDKPTWVGACHCLDCRKISGAPYTVFAGFEVKDVMVTKGEPRVYASSTEVTRTFCQTCSAPITWKHQQSEKMFIPIGILDEAEKLAPTANIWTERKLPWVNIGEAESPKTP